MLKHSEIKCWYSLGIAWGFVGEPSLVLFVTIVTWMISDSTLIGSTESSSPICTAVFPPVCQITRITSILERESLRWITAFLDFVRVFISMWVWASNGPVVSLTLDELIWISRLESNVCAGFSVLRSDNIENHSIFHKRILHVWFSAHLAVIRYNSTYIVTGLCTHSQPLTFPLVLEDIALSNLKLGYSSWGKSSFFPKTFFSLKVEQVSIFACFLDRRLDLINGIQLRLSRVYQHLKNHGVVLGGIAMKVGIVFGVCISTVHSHAQCCSLSLQQSGSVLRISFDLWDLGAKITVGLSGVSFPRIPKGISANSRLGTAFHRFFVSEDLFSGMTKRESYGERNQSFHIWILFGIKINYND